MTFVYNPKLHGYHRKTVQVAEKFEKQFLDEFSVVHAKEDEAQGRWKPSQQWIPPNNCRYKLNFNGAVNRVTTNQVLSVLYIRS